MKEKNERLGVNTTRREKIMKERLGKKRIEASWKPWKSNFPYLR